MAGPSDQPQAVVRVAAGVLRRPDGCVLLAQRPAGKIAAGRWEFPGGKIEADETPRAALERELREEIGISVHAARPLLRLRHAYTERTVELDTWLIESWQGEPSGLEDQALAWVQPARIWDYDVLEADGPIVDALRLPPDLPITPDLVDAKALSECLLALAEQGYPLIRLRAPRLSDQDYAAVVAHSGPRLRAIGAGLVVDRGQAGCLLVDGVAGLQLTAQALHGGGQPVLAPGQWVLASCHNAEELAMACALGAHALVIGPVHATPTHPDATVLGLDGFAALAARANRPCYALGGVTPADRDAVFAHGGQGVAGISAFQPAARAY